MDHILKHGIVGETSGGNKLFKTGEFMREYGECELGPKCPNHPKHVRDTKRKYKHKSLLF